MFALNKIFNNALLIFSIWRNVESYCIDTSTWDATEGSGFSDKTCFSQCNNMQGHCPDVCGESELCCTMNKEWKDTSNGCDGSFGGECRHECVKNPKLQLKRKTHQSTIDNNFTPNHIIPTKVRDHNLTSYSPFTTTDHHSNLCEANGVQINISIYENSNKINRKIWCGVPYHLCFHKWADLAFWIDGVIKVTIASTGVIMNLFFSYILTHKELRNGFNCLLIALATIDNIFLVGHVIQSCRVHFKLPKRLHAGLSPHIVIPFRTIMLNSSIFMIIAISMERYFAVSKPIRLHLKMKYKKRANLKIVMKYVVPVIALSLIFTIPKFFEAKEAYDEVTGGQLITATKLRTDENYIFYYIGLAQLIVTGVLPFWMILFFNIRTYTTIRSRRNGQFIKNDEELHPETVSQTHTEQSKGPMVLRTNLAAINKRRASEERLSMIFSAISLLFLVCNSPRFILDFYKLVSKRDWMACQNAGYLGYPLWAVILSWASQILLAISSSLNSMIYCVFSSEYRKQIKKTFKLYCICN